MTEPADLQQVPLSELAGACAHETERFRLRLGSDGRYCLELFRRAIADADEHAWTMFAAQFQPQIARWIEKHPAFGQCGEELDDLVAHVQSRLWLSFATHKEKLPRFRTLQSVLSYCKMCVHSEIVDSLRQNKPIVESDQVVDDAVPESVPAEALWEYIVPRLKDDQERLVMNGLFVYGMGPKDLWQRFPNRFASVAEIYRVKQNVIARLRRDDEFRKLFGQDD